jgi:hypothetical protein
VLIYQSTFQRLEEAIVLHEKQGFFIPQPTVAELECKILAWHFNFGNTQGTLKLEENKHTFTFPC